MLFNYILNHILQMNIVHVFCTSSPILQVLYNMLLFMYWTDLQTGPIHNRDGTAGIIPPALDSKTLRKYKKSLYRNSFCVGMEL